MSNDIIQKTYLYLVTGIELASDAKAQKHTDKEVSKTNECISVFALLLCSLHKETQEFKQLSSLYNRQIQLLTHSIHCDSHQRLNEVKETLKGLLEKWN